MKQTALYHNGNTLSYAEYGDKNGYPILIQHGLIAAITDYPLFNRLIELGTHLICIARPGYGASSPYMLKNIAEWGDIVSVLVEKLNLSQFDVLGMSSGAPYSYAIGCKIPNQTRNIFIFSGTPALYDPQVLANWPYEMKKGASIAEMEKLAHELFFANLSPEDLQKEDIKDSLMNHCFGVALDLKIRGEAWGFSLADLKTAVFIQHSRFDPAVPFITAELTAKLLPRCRLRSMENDVHFTPEALDEFIQAVMAGHF